MCKVCNLPQNTVIAQNGPLAGLIKRRKRTVGLAQGKQTDFVLKGNQVEKPTLPDAGTDKKLSSRKRGPLVKSW